MYLLAYDLFDKCDEALIAKFTAFVRKVVRNSKMDYLKQQKHLTIEIPLERISEDMEQELTLEDIVISQMDQFVFEEERIASAFKDLSLMKQKILRLTYINQLSAPEIATQLNCSVRFVYNQRARALKLLRDILQSGGDDSV